MPNIPTTQLPVETTSAGVSDVVVNTTSGQTRRLPKEQISPPIATQEEAEEAASNTPLMTPLRSKQLVVKYGLLKDYATYPLKTSISGTDTVLISDSAAQGQIARVSLQQFVTQQGLRAATTEEAISLASPSVAITPATLNTVVSARRGWIEKFVPHSEETVDVTSTSILLQGAAQRAILPSADSGIDQCVIVNATTRPVLIYPSEGRKADGAYFGGNTRINFPRTGTLGGLESTSNLTALTGYFVFSADSLPISDFRTLASCVEKIAGAYKGWELVYSQTVGKPFIFMGYNGTSSTPSTTFTSPANPFTAGSIVELVFSFDLVARSFIASINGTTAAWTTVFPAGNAIVMPPATQQLSIGSGSYGSYANTTQPHIGNIFRAALWSGYYTPSISAIREAERPKNIGVTGWRVRNSWNLPASLYLNSAGDAFRTNNAPDIDITQNVTGTLSGSNVVPAPSGSGVLAQSTMVVSGALATHTIMGTSGYRTLPIGRPASFGLVEGRTEYVRISAT